jgi:hypothetical protein
MSLTELKQSILTLPEKERHEFVIWVNRLEADYGDVPGEALDQLAAEIWDRDNVCPIPCRRLTACKEI